MVMATPSWGPPPFVSSFVSQPLHPYPDRQMWVVSLHIRSATQRTSVYVSALHSDSNAALGILHLVQVTSKQSWSSGAESHKR